MNKFYRNFALSWVFIVAGLTACATLEKHSAVVGLVVSQATMRYIESKPVSERASVAARVVSVATDIEAVASGKPVTIAELARLALSAIPSNLAPADRQLAIAIVSIAAQELQLKIGEGVLTAEQSVTVNEVVKAIRFAAEVYIPKVSP